MNPRRPTPADLKSAPFVQARAPPLFLGSGRVCCFIVVVWCAKKLVWFGFLLFYAVIVCGFMGSWESSVMIVEC